MPAMFMSNINGDWQRSWHTPNNGFGDGGCDLEKGSNTRSIWFGDAISLRILLDCLYHMTGLNALLIVLKDIQLSGVKLLSFMLAGIYTSTANKSFNVPSETCYIIPGNVIMLARFLEG